MIELMSLLLNFVLASGLIYYGSRRRREAAEASSAEQGAKQTEFATYKQSVEFLSRQLSEAYSEIDKMQDIINAKRSEIIELIRRTKQLEVDLINQESSSRKLILRSCVREDCSDRQEYHQKVEKHQPQEECAA